MRYVGLLLFAVLVVFVAADPVYAQTGTGALTGGPVGAGLVILGAGFGFGKIGAAALEGMARQPEAAKSIQPAMIIVGAFLEGATFFALLVCMIA